MSAAVMLPELASAEELRVAKIRRFSAKRITEALLATEGRRDIERLLAIGEVCPYAGMRECRDIWVEEFRRLWAERSGSHPSAESIAA